MMSETTWWFRLVGEDRTRSMALPCRRDDRKEAGRLLKQTYGHRLQWWKPFDKGEDFMRKVGRDATNSEA